MSRKRDEDNLAVQASSGNLFADWGRLDAEEALARVRLARHITEIVEQRGLNQTDAAVLMGLDQPKVPALVRGRWAGFSTDRLLRCLTALGQDVEIVVRDKPSDRPQAHISVVMAAGADQGGAFKAPSP